MTDLADLYQELIIDHGRNPRNFATNEDANKKLEGFNPLCGDRLTIYVQLENDLIESICFQGKGCAISIASASLMTQALQGKTLAEAQELFAGFHQLVTEGNATHPMISDSKLAALSGVVAFPARVKCATLAWHTFLGAINKS